MRIIALIDDPPLVNKILKHLDLMKPQDHSQCRFALGTLEDKRDILAALGSNLSLLDRKLSITLTKPLELVGEVAPEVQALHNRLEPLYALENQGAWEEKYAENEKWGG